MTHTDDSGKYEELVKELIRALTSTIGEVRAAEIRGGRCNRIYGASGFEHQIDVSVRTSQRLHLIECKLWSSRIDVEPVLVMASRLMDIRGANPTITVNASLVSADQATEGAQLVAGYFGISLDVAISPQKYAVRVYQYVFTGLTDGLQFSDRCDADIAKRSS